MMRGECAGRETKCEGRGLPGLRKTTTSSWLLSS
jgi:hypothetical protein